MFKQLILVIFVLCGISMNTIAENFVDIVNEGNEAFINNDYETAMEKYHMAETEIPESPELFYNMANVSYNLEDYERAVENFTKALNSPDIMMEARANYNLGNTYFKMGDYQKAIESYENSLKINPEDLDAKFNLELARKMLKENTKPEQQDQDQQQQQEQKQEEQQQQEEQDQDQQEQQDKDQEQQEQDQDKQDQQQQQQDDKEMSKEDAERILNALKDDEQDIQKKIKRMQAAGTYSGRDW